MSNEFVGIVGVFALTLILFVLRHFYLSSGQTNKSRQANTTAARQNREGDSLATANDDWLLWNDERDEQRRSPNPFGDGYRKPHGDVKGQSKERTLQ